MTSADRNSTEWIDLPGGELGIDPATGAITALQLVEPATRFIDTADGRGLLRVAAPRTDYPSHYLEAGTHGRPEVERRNDGLRLVYPDLVSDYHPGSVRVEIDVAHTEDGLALRARVHNGSREAIPQVVFPRLLGLEAVGGVDQTRLQLARHRVHPFRELHMRPDDAWWLDRGLQTYVPYGAIEFSMKWLDYGDARSGLTLYSRNSCYTTQGLLIARQDRDVDLVDVNWLHYPFIEPGETWDSGEYVVLLHPGDWYAGARAYRSFAVERYPYHAPRHLREALGIRTVWPAVRNAPPTFSIDQVSDYAAEIADPDLGLAELCVWHWWLKNGYPIFLDPRLGTEDDFSRALQRCRELGVPVSLFVSHHLLWDTDETDPDWRHLNAAGQPVQSNWTYGRDFLPLFQVPFSGTHAMVRGSALTPGWRATGLRSYAHLLELGATGICFDQFSAWPDPNFSPHADGRPDEEGEKLIEFAEQARALIRDAEPAGTFSGEHISDVKVPVLDYTWEWRSAYHIADAAPFRYVFPEYRLNANVNEHPRGALIAFAEGALLNVMPGNMHSYRLADCPDLVKTLRKLARLRRQFLRYFTEGQFRHLEGLEATNCIARLYTHNDDILVIATNPTDDLAEISLEIDPTAWGGSASATTAMIRDLDANVIGKVPVDGNRIRYTATLAGDGLCILELAAS